MSRYDGMPPGIPLYPPSIPTPNVYGSADNRRNAPGVGAIATNLAVMGTTDLSPGTLVFLRPTENRNPNNHIVYNIHDIKNPCVFTDKELNAIDIDSHQKVRETPYLMGILYSDYTQSAAESRGYMYVSIATKDTMEFNIGDDDVCKRLKPGDDIIWIGFDAYKEKEANAAIQTIILADTTKKYKDEDINTKCANYMTKTFPAQVDGTNVDNSVKATIIETLEKGVFTEEFILNRFDVGSHEIKSAGLKAFNEEVDVTSVDQTNLESEIGDKIGKLYKEMITSVYDGVNAIKGNFTNLKGESEAYAGDATTDKITESYILQSKIAAELVGHLLQYLQGIVPPMEPSPLDTSKITWPASKFKIVMQTISNFGFNKENISSQKLYDGKSNDEKTTKLPLLATIVTPVFNGFTRVSLQLV